MSAHKKENSYRYYLLAKGYWLIIRRHKNKFLKDLKRYYKDLGAEVTIRKVKR